MNLKEWAVSAGVSCTTARRWFGAGKLPVPAEKVGGLVLADGPGRLPAPAGAGVVYARVSSAGQGPDLDRQVARVTARVTSRGVAVDRVVTEVGPALDGRRRGLLALLADPSVTVIAVGHRGRLARFGTGYVEAALPAQGRLLLVADPSQAGDDLVRDVREVLTSLCARLYGRRVATSRAARGISAVAGEVP